MSNNKSNTQQPTKDQKGKVESAKDAYQHPSGEPTGTYKHPSRGEKTGTYRHPSEAENVEE